MIAQVLALLRAMGLPPELARDIVYKFRGVVHPLSLEYRRPMLRPWPRPEALVDYPGWMRDMARDHQTEWRLPGPG